MGLTQLEMQHLQKHKKCMIVSGSLCLPASEHRQHVYHPASPNKCSGGPTARPLSFEKAFPTVTKSLNLQKGLSMDYNQHTPVYLFQQES